MSVALIVLGVFAVAVGVSVWAALTAPFGYQDEAGFHFAPPQQMEQYEYAEELVLNPS